MKKYPLQVAAALLALIGFGVWLWPDTNPIPASSQEEEGAGGSAELHLGSSEPESPGALESIQGVHRESVDKPEKEVSTPSNVSGNLLVRSSSGLPVERVTILYADGSDRTFQLHTPGLVALEWFTPGSLLKALGHIPTPISGHEEEITVEPFHEMRLQGIPANQALPVVLGLGGAPAILENQGQVCGPVDGDWVLLTEPLDFNPPFYRLSVPGQGVFSLSLQLGEGRKGHVPWSEIVASHKPNLPVTFEAHSEGVLQPPLHWSIMLNPPEPGHDWTADDTQWNGEWGTLRQSVFSGTQMETDGATLALENLPRGWAGRVVVVDGGGQFGWHTPFRNEGGIVEVEVQAGPRIEGHIHLEGQHQPKATVELGIEFMKGSASRFSFQATVDGFIQLGFPLSPFEAGAWSLQGVPDSLRMTWKSPGYEPYSWMQPLDLNAEVLSLPTVSLKPTMSFLAVHGAAPILEKNGLDGIDRRFNLSKVEAMEGQESQRLYLTEGLAQALQEPYLVAWSKAGEVFLKREGGAFRAMSLVPYRINLSRETAALHPDTERFLVLGGARLRVSKLDVPLDEGEPVSYEVLAPEESVFLLFESKEGERKLFPLQPRENAL